MMTATYIFLMLSGGFEPSEGAPYAARSATTAGSAALVLSALFFLRAIAKKPKNTESITRR